MEYAFESKFKSKFSSKFGAMGGGLSFYLPTYGMQAWYDASSASNFVNESDVTPSNGDKIKQWLDKSGNGNHTAVQGTGTARPTWNSTGLNSLGVAGFDGGDILSLPSALYSIPNGANTIFALINQTSGLAQRVINIGVTSGAVSRYSIEGTVTPTVTFQNNGTAVTKSWIPGSFYIITGYRSGTTQGIYLNGGTATTNTNATNASDSDSGYIGGRVGGVAQWVGSVAEIIIYNRALSTTEITQVHRYLSNKWNIAIT